MFIDPRREAPNLINNAVIEVEVTDQLSCYHRSFIQNVVVWYYFMHFLSNVKEELRSMLIKKMLLFLGKNFPKVALFLHFLIVPCSSDVPTSTM